MTDVNVAFSIVAAAFFGAGVALAWARRELDRRELDRARRALRDGPPAAKAPERTASPADDFSYRSACAFCGTWRTYKLSEVVWPGYAPCTACGRTKVLHDPYARVKT